MQCNCRIASAPQTKSKEEKRSKGNSKVCCRSFQLSGQPTYNKQLFYWFF